MARQTVNETKWLEYKAEWRVKIEVCDLYICLGQKSKREISSAIHSWLQERFLTHFLGTTLIGIQLIENIVIHADETSYARY